LQMVAERPREQIVAWHVALTTPSAALRKLQSAQRRRVVLTLG